MIRSLLSQSSFMREPYTMYIERGQQYEKLYIHDFSLKEKCKQSKESWRYWRDASRPRSGPLYEDMKFKKQDVKQHVDICCARQERKHLQQRDTLLRNKDSTSFHVPQNATSCR